MNKFTLKEVGLLIGAINLYHKRLVAKKNRAYTPNSIEKTSKSIEAIQIGRAHV